MKTETASFNLMVVISGLLLAGFVILTEGGITPADRQFAVRYLTDTREGVVQVAAPLTADQFNFKPNDSSWSIAQCLEHIAKAEDFIFELSQNALKNPAERGDLTFSDDQLIVALADRSQKVKTLQPLEPTSSFSSPEEALRAFVDRRNRHIQYLRKTKDDLRGSYFDFPFGKGDAYQVILFAGAHSERHKKQIMEIKDHLDFPQK